MWRLRVPFAASNQKTSPCHANLFVVDCEIKFQWIGGMTSIPIEWICRGLSSSVNARARTHTQTHVSPASAEDKAPPYPNCTWLPPRWEESAFLQVRSAHNVIGCLLWRSGTPADNPVTYTSGLNKLRAKKTEADALFSTATVCSSCERGRLLACAGKFPRRRCDRHSLAGPDSSLNPHLKPFLLPDNRLACSA